MDSFEKIKSDKSKKKRYCSQLVNYLLTYIKAHKAEKKINYIIIFITRVQLLPKTAKLPFLCKRTQFVK